jgi:hypothetical protein
LRTKKHQKKHNKLKWQPSEKEMSHPADGEAWQDFDREFSEFAKDARNVRLGLATDRFNPFLEKNIKYNMWPVSVLHTTFHHGNAWKSQTT